MTAKPPHSPFVLLILDGFGHRQTPEHNAVHHAEMPCWDRLMREGASTYIEGSGGSVGLPAGQMGNSEVGHLTIGAGRIIHQDFSRITQAIEGNELARNPVLLKAIQKAKDLGRTIHIMGLVSDGGVHSHLNHILGMLDFCESQEVPRVRVHAFLDGRDTPPKSAEGYLKTLEEKCHQCKDAAVATISGRFFAMDRDQNWDRIERTYDLLVREKTLFHYENAAKALESAYARKETDEFVQPSSVGEKSPIKDGDVVVFMNFRADRARELTKAFVEDPFTHFIREKVALSDFVTLTEYQAGLPVHIAFPPQVLRNTIGEVMAKAHIPQLRIAETEKYAHVTFFLNGGEERLFKGEDRVLIPSPKVKTYDLQPEMSAPQLTEALVEAIESNKYGLIICNYANPDMVGHTGNFDATVKALETIDRCLEAVVEALQNVGGELIITADHGNAERMFDEKTGQPHTAHTSDPVPFVYLGRKAHIIKHEAGLSDIAPTLLSLMGITIPDEMTGSPIVKVS